MGPSQEAIQVLKDLNPWWADPRQVRPPPPSYRRPLIRDLCGRLKKPQGLIEVIRGPRQVGKTTGMLQLVQDLLASGLGPRDILFIRFDLEVLREETAALRQILRWYEANIRGRSFSDGDRSLVLLDEVHKVHHWQDEVKHAGDTFPLRMVLTGSSSTLIARGGRESLAGRIFTTEFPPFSFREMLEVWKPEHADVLPPRIPFLDAFEGQLQEVCEAFDRLKAQQKLALWRALERYYNRGGYPRLYTGEIDDDRWADYLVQTVFDNVLGADIPDLFPVRDPRLLRHLYLRIARGTATEISQNELTKETVAAGYETNQPTVGKYMHYLADALLIREFRRYPLAKRASARVPAKIALNDLGVRNAIFRGAPSLAESDPAVLGPLVETLVQGCIRGTNLQVHFFRDFENPRDRRSPVREVDFVAERLDGEVLPIEVKFRKRIDAEDLRGLNVFKARFDPSLGILVTRDVRSWDPASRILQIPLLAFLLAF